ncbi:DUF1120 domain-containing protein [Andreprevotia chitinilytica]|uniref:DUF1120 domain-containing protein n=1 Tax=Andreprevotia chitinilytica TaxID=396808 RepID=UPI000552C254|nr:DUF1120 domain-containing protein [Andreprevotia chitinilytica]
MTHTQLTRAITTALLGGALFAAASAGFAATTLTVRGTVSPAACTPTFVGGSSAVNFGATYASSLTPDGYKDLGTRDVTLQVTCDAPVVAVMRVTDSRATSTIATAVGSLDNVAATKLFGLGTVKDATDKDVQIGSYNIKIKSAPTVDATASSSAITTTDKKTWAKAATAQFLAADGSEFYAAGTAANANISGLVTQFPMTLHAVANKGNVLPTTKDITLDGAAQFEVSYL